MTIRAHSFDVFDTCLVRRWPRPVDLLRAVAEEVTPQPPGTPGYSELVSELVRLRQAAEAQAMARLGRDAVGLAEIYAGDEPFRQAGVDPRAMLRSELELERTGIRPVRAALDRVAAARDAGLKVLFISDMYLPASEIRARLEEHGIAQAGDPVYVSGDLGLSKRTGRLFDHVLRQEALAPGELLHHGDDTFTDDAAAVARGIAVRPLRTGKLSRFEAETLARADVPQQVAVHLSGLTRGTRVTITSERAVVSEVATIAADVVAPMFACFAAWVLKTAREEGIERLYFVSRDGQVLLKAAQGMRRPGDPQCRYLYGSRLAWFLPSVDAVDRRELAFILDPEGSLRTPRALLAKLAIAPEELAASLSARGLDPDARLGAKGLEAFWSAVEENAEVVRAHAAGARRRLSSYLEQEGLHAPGRWAIVDLGWRGNAQRALRRVLLDSGHADRLLGLYFGQSQERAPLAETGPTRAFFLEGNELRKSRSPEDWVFDHMSFIEQVFAVADHGSCRGYSEASHRIEPLLRDIPRDGARDAYVACLHDAVVDFSRAVAASGVLDDHLDAVRRAASLNARLLIERPTRREARALAWLRVSDDQNETRVQALAAPLTSLNLVRQTAHKLGFPVTRDFGTDHLWREGSLRLSSPGIRAADRTMRSAQVRAIVLRASVQRSGAVRRARIAVRAWGAMRP